MPFYPLRYATALTLFSLSFPATGATVKKIFANKKAMIVVLDDQEVKSIKSGDDLIVQEDSNQPDNLVDADVIYIRNGKALLSLSAMNSNDKEGQKIHLYNKEAPQKSKSRATGDSEAKAPQVVMPGEKHDKHMNQKFNDLDSSMEQTFGNMDTLIAAPKEVEPKEEPAGPVPAIKLMLLKSSSTNPVNQARVQACNKTGMHLDEALIELTLSNHLVSYDSKITLTGLIDRACVEFAIEGVDAKKLTDDTVVVLKKMTINQGPTTIKTEMVLGTPVHPAPTAAGH